MNKQTLLTSVIGVVALLGVVFGFSALHKKPSLQVGSVSGPDSFFPCETHDGMGQCFNKVGLTQATTTICQIQSPSATSTLSRASLHINIASSTTNIFTFALATTKYATTTVLTTNIGTAATVASGLEANIYASSTVIISPNTWFVIGQAGNGAGSTAGAGINFSEQGECQAKFDIL